MILLILITLLSSCKSLPKDNDIVWAKFPSPMINGESVIRFNAETKEVTMPISYWRSIVFYVADTEANIKILNELK